MSPRFYTNTPVVAAIVMPTNKSTHINKFDDNEIYDDDEFREDVAIMIMMWRCLL